MIDHAKPNDPFPDFSHFFHYEVHPGRGPYLLLVHGMLSSRAQWAPNLPALARFSRPVVIELFGHGRSSAPEDASCYAPAAYVARFEALRERLGAERWWLCGQSLGAALTLRYALEHPSRILAHVFTNSNSALADDDWATATRPAMDAFAETLRAKGRAALEGLPIHPKNARRLPREAKGALVADSRLHSVVGLANTGLHTVVGSSVRKEAAKNRVPSLLLHGTRERRFAESLRYAKTSIPNLEVEGLDAGHAVNLEAREPFEVHAGRFLAAHRP
jgi:2-succinyl-6-hydroxy-2,4-cyclohexadiene-1-carboxylate synthase